ncbi:MAG: hypothetical protein HY321_01815 [Armatimonadetes bacterium]|nr:hypothetical protein [Armatimonadota bacterium]
MTSQPLDDYRTRATVGAVRPGRSTVRATYQLAADVLVRDGSVDDTFRAAVEVVLDWCAGKFPGTVADLGPEMPYYKELDYHGQHQFRAVSLPDDGLWSARLVHPDTPFRGQPAVAGRTWTTELALHRGEREVRFGVRVVCASAPFATDPIALTRPRIVLDLAREFGLREVRALDGRPWVLQTEDDLQALYELLCDGRRTMPVVMLTQPNPRVLPVIVSEYLLNDSLLARETQGFAHVVCMPHDLGYAWTNMVGQVWSAFLGAVRTYYPGLDFDSGSPFDHPRVLAERARFWSDGERVGPDAFASFLVGKLQEQASSKHVDWGGGTMFLADARARWAALTRERARRDIEQQTHADEAASLRAQIEALEKAHAQEVEALLEKVTDAENDTREFDDLATEYKRRVDQSERENRSLQAQNDALRGAIRTKTGSSADVAIPIPESYGDMADWVEQHLAGRLVLHPRALRGIKDAKYQDVELVYRCLLLLAGHYRDMQMGHSDVKGAWESELKHYAVTFRRSITRERAGEEGETYFVRYPLATGPRQFLEYHLVKGSTKDDHLCMRVYFLWDSDTQQVVVGWLPSHLDTRAT